MIEKERNSQLVTPKIEHVTVQQVYNEYCEFGRAGKAYSTIKKQDSLQNNHIKSNFGKRYVDDISVAEIIMSTLLKKYLLSVKRHRDEIMVSLAEQREQNQTMLSDMGKEKISSLELVNSLDEGKIQTVNSMKYHTQKYYLGNSKQGVDILRANLDSMKQRKSKGLSGLYRSFFMSFYGQFCQTSSQNNTCFIQ